MSWLEEPLHGDFLNTLADRTIWNFFTLYHGCSEYSNELKIIVLIGVKNKHDWAVQPQPQSPHPEFRSRLSAAICARSQIQEGIEIRELRGEVKFVEPTH